MCSIFQPEFSNHELRLSTPANKISNDQSCSASNIMHHRSLSRISPHPPLPNAESPSVLSAGMIRIPINAKDPLIHYLLIIFEHKRRFRVPRQIYSDNVPSEFLGNQVKELASSLSVFKALRPVNRQNQSRGDEWLRLNDLLQ